MNTVFRLKPQFFSIGTLVFFLCIYFSRASDFPCQHPSETACSDYKLIKDSQRNARYKTSKNGGFLSDNGLQEGWYRFQVNGHDVTMPTFCVEPDHCGTETPVWMSGSLPSKQDSAITSKACLNRGNDPLVSFLYPGPKCCQESQEICVKNCGGYYVYRLTRVAGPNIAYCAGDEPVQTSPTVQGCPAGKYGPYCLDLYPKMSGPPVLGNPICDNGHLKFPCSIPFDPSDKRATFKVTWSVDGKELTTPQATKIVSNGTRVAYLDGLYLIHNTGKHLQCTVTSYYPSVNKGSQHLTSIGPGTYIGVTTSPKTIIVSESGGPKEITLSTTIPQCPPLGSTPSCDFEVELQASNNFSTDISTTSCSYIFKYNPVTHECEAKIPIVATKDFLKDGNKNHTLSFRPIQPMGHATLQNAIWTHHQINPVQVTSVDSQHGSCSSHGDPHINPISPRGMTVNAYDVGDMIMYRANAGCVQRHLEVHVRTKRCGSHASCVCGIAAVEGNDYIRMDGCTGHRLYRSQNLVDGTTLHTDRSGRKFYINFPSGARLTATYRGSTLNPVHLIVPPDHHGCSSGHCNNFNNVLMDASGQITRSKNSFAHSWLIQNGQSLFYKRSTNPSAQQGHRYCQCKSGVATCSGSAHNPLKRIFAGGIGILLDRVFDNWHRHVGKRTESALSTEEIDTKKRSLSWPTSSGITLNNATDLCQTTLRKSSLYKFCQESLDDYSGLMYGCTEDIKISDSLDFLDGYILTYDETCLTHLASDVKNYVTGRDGQLTLLNTFTSGVCPNHCSFRGSCQQGQCLCHNGYHGPDCSVLENVPPKIITIAGESDNDGLCDIRHEKCLSAYVIAENLLYSSYLKCYLQPLKKEGDQIIVDEDQQSSFVNGSFQTFNELECHLPATSMSKGTVVGGYRITITTDGKHFSDYQSLIIYDSLCQDCHANGTCRLKPNTCEIHGYCRHSGEQNSAHQVCEPSINKYSWSDDVRVKMIDYYTASTHGCVCFDYPNRHDCACCQNGGCQCGSSNPQRCVNCKQTEQCRDNVQV